MNPCPFSDAVVELVSDSRWRWTACFHCRTAVYVTRFSRIEAHYLGGDPEAEATVLRVDEWLRVRRFAS